MMPKLTLSTISGHDVLRVIEQQLRFAIPREGILAGQAVTTIILYLLGMERNLNINDFDVFTTRAAALGLRQPLTRANSYDKSIDIRPRQSSDMSWSRQALGNGNGRQLRKKFAEDIGEGSMSITTYESLFFNHSSRFVDGGCDSSQEYSAEIMQECVEKSDRLASWAGSMGLMTSSAETMKFRSKPIMGSYEILSSKRDGMLNTVVVDFSSEVDFNGNCQGAAAAYAIIDAFDLNANQVAVDLVTGQLVYTHHFEEFSRTLQLRIVRISRYWHSLIRYFKKKTEHGYYGHDQSEIDKVMTYHALRNCIGIDESINDSEHLRINKLSPESRLSSSPMLGSRYKAMFDQSSVKDLFSIRNVDVGSYYSRLKGLVLYEVGPSDSIENEYTNGHAKSKLEESLGCGISGFRAYSMATVIPYIESVHGQLSSKRYHRGVLNALHLCRPTPSKTSKVFDYGERDFAYHMNALREPGYDNLDVIIKMRRFIDKHPEIAPLLRVCDRKQLRNALEVVTAVERDNIESLYKFLEVVNFCTPEDIQSSDALIAAAKKSAELNKEGARDEFFGRFDLNNVNFKELRYSYELKSEGRHMQHCVGSYFNRVNSYNEVIFALSGRGRSTLHVTLAPYRFMPASAFDHNLCMAKIVQHRSKLNRPPPEHHDAAAKLWVRQHNQRVRAQRKSAGLHRERTPQG